MRVFGGTSFAFILFANKPRKVWELTLSDLLYDSFDIALGLELRPS